MKASQTLLAFNRGIVSPLALARLDLKRMSMSAETQANWMPRALGSMMLRPGLKYLTPTRSNAFAKCIPFVFAADDTALIEISDGYMRVLVDDAVITRGSVSSAITNGLFTSNVTSWTDADEGSASSVWATGGYLSLTGTGSDAAIRRQEVTVAGADQGDEHALKIIIERGPVTFKCGSTAGDDDYISETSLETGEHSLAFTPTGNFWVEFSNRLEIIKLVDSIAVESSGAMTLSAPWAESDLGYLRWAQSADVIFLACRGGYQQRKIERRGTRSWSLVEYKSDDGPFRVENVGPITIALGALTGNTTLTASKALFKSTHVGSLWRVSSVGQTVALDISAEDTFGDPIEVTGVGDARVFSILVQGTFTATVTLQRSVNVLGSWEDMENYTTVQNKTYDDGLDNQIVYYRLGIKTGNYTSDTAETRLTYSSGSITGVGRVTSYVSATVVNIEVLQAFGGTDASDVWSEGSWSDYRGWPSAVALHEGRLWFAGQDKFYASITDAFSSFDDGFEGDAGPISRSIGTGPVENINWLQPLARLLAGTDSAVMVGKSTSFDEPMTPTNFNVKEPVTIGASDVVSAVKIDSRAVFVQRNGRRVFEVAYDLTENDYTTGDLTVLAPDVCSPGVVEIDVQRIPDTRIHCVLSDGTVAVLVNDKAEEVKCWVKIETDGEIEDVTILPGSEESSVYYVVYRTINGNPVRYHEKMSLESEAIGGSSNRLADSWISASAASGVVTGLSHLQGESVVVWGDSRDLGTYTVSGGSITLSETYTGTVIVGLGYSASFKSARLGFVMQDGRSSLGARKRVDRLGVVLSNAHAQGLQYGKDLTTMDNLPLIEQGTDIDTDLVGDYEEPTFEFPGEWTTDARLCLKASAPRPCTVLAAYVDFQANPK